MSPTVLREYGFTVHVFYPPREHPPPHVHVMKAGVEVELFIADASVKRNAGMSAHDVAMAQSIVRQNKKTLLGIWRLFHAKD